MKPIYVKKNGEVNKISGIVNPSSYSADDITYDGSTSGLTADDVQEAIDEIVDGLGTAASKNVGVSNGVAELDSSGKVPSSQLPSYVDDVIEVDDYAHLPITGESGKIYVTKDTNKTYRWTGTGYVEISESLALGETSETAYRGDRGKTAYDHATETKLSTATASGLYKVAGTAQGHIASLTAVTKADITALGISDENVKQSPSTNNATYEILFSGSADNTEHIEGVKKSNKLTFNPSTGGLMNGNAGVANGSYSHAEGSRTTAQSDYSHAEGYYAFTNGNYSHAEGVSTSANGLYSHAEGHQTAASSTASHSEGASTSASGSYSHAEGLSTSTSGSSAHAEGKQTTAYGDSSHAEGYKALTIGNYSHAEGQDTKAVGDYSHAEGFQTSANGSASHAEGRQTTASGDFTHSEGYATVASNTAAHAEGYNTTASGKYSHAEGVYTSAGGEGQLVIGKYNTPDTTSLFIVGNGTANNARSNAMTVDATGNLSITKINGVTVGNSPKFTDTTYSDATTSVSGLMSATDKTKLNGIATGAEVNQNAFSNVKVGSTTVAADSKTDTLELVAGSNVTLTPDATNDKVTIAATDTNTTYTFAGGTNKFTVTPSGGSAQDVTITPSIANNITGSGTSGYLTKFNGTNTITNGPQLGSDTTKYLRNDGTWVKPPNDNTTYTFTGGTNQFVVTPSTGSASTVTITPSIGVATTSANGLMSSSDKTKLNGIATGAEVNQNAFSTIGVKVGSTTTNVAADSKTDTVTLIQGTNVTLTADATNDTVTIAATDTNNRKSFYGTCDTAAGTAAKVVTLADTAGWELKAGTIVGVKFTNTNSASNVTLNVNGSGAKSIWYNNAAYTGSSNTVCGYAARMTYYMYDGSTYWVWMSYGIDLNDNTYDRNRYTGTIKCGTTAIAKNNIIVGKDGVFAHLKSGSSFDINYPILYAASDIAANGTGNDNYDVLAVNLQTTQSITLTAYKPVYIKGTLTGRMFTPYQAACLTQTVPTAVDNYHYMLLGVAYSTTNIYLDVDHRIFAFYNNTFGELTIHTQTIKQVVTNTDQWRKVLLGEQYEAEDTAAVETQGRTLVTSIVQVQPSTNTLKATNLRAASNVTGNILVVRATNGTSGGISLNGSESNLDKYGIYFRTTSNKGKHGYVQSDWATYFTMHSNSGDASRGWVFRNNQNSTNIASISQAGNAVFNGSVTVGGNAANTSGARLEFNSNTNAIDFIFN